VVNVEHEIARWIGHHALREVTPQGRHHALWSKGWRRAWVMCCARMDGLKHGCEFRLAYAVNDFLGLSQV